MVKEHLVDRVRERSGRETEQDIELTREELVQEYLQGVKIVDHKTLQEAAGKITEKLACRNLLITLGPDGMILFNGQYPNGYHIPPEARPKIFTLCFSTKPGGTGVGLAMAYRIIQLHNGSIDFESEVGRGTTFRISLPR
jgi:sensor histidine kinase regulating citrate/malate metabolism